MVLDKNPAAMLYYFTHIFVHFIFRVIPDSGQVCPPVSLKKE